MPERKEVCTYRRPEYNEYMSEIEKTKLWLEQFVIGLNICPFAKVPNERGLIQIHLCAESDLKKRMDFFQTQVDHIEKFSGDELSNMLLIYPKAESSFLSFLQFEDRLTDELLERNLQSTYQLVAFHPEFQFQGSEINDRENLVNSSPYPMIHLLRHEEVARAAKASSHPEDIHLKNVETLKALKIEQLTSIFPWKKNLR